MERITSKDNKWIKEYVKLASSKSYRDETGLFALESVKLVAEAYESKLNFEMVFVTQACCDKYLLELEKLFQSTDMLINIISDEVSKKMSDQNSPQGIYAICKKLDKPLSVDKIYSMGKYIMLVNLQDCGNVGTIIRTAEAVGIDGIIMTGSSCDIYNPKVIRGSMGSIFRMEFLIEEDCEALLSKLSEKGVSSYASVVSNEAESLENVLFGNSSVLLIGNEGNGLDEIIQNMCSKKITIKMAGKTESLNASMAACILMWEMTKQRGIIHNGGNR